MTTRVIRWASTVVLLWLVWEHSHWAVALMLTLISVRLEGGRSYMTIAAMLRVKNEARWIEQVIDSILPLSSDIVVLDDHSTDDTVAIANGAGATVIPSPFEGLDEARDKNFLLGAVMATKADWVLCIDGDEVLEPSGIEKIHLELDTWPITARPPDAFSFRILYLWDRPDQIRTDGIYGKFQRPSLFRLKPGQKFRTTPYGKNFHCGNVPDFMGAQTTDIGLLHYGYLHREDRLRKYAWYNEMDPKNSFEDGYRHMVIGDLFPAESKFRHAGPLKVEPL